MTMLYAILLACLLGVGMCGPPKGKRNVTADGFQFNQDNETLESVPESPGDKSPADVELTTESIVMDMPQTSDKPEMTTEGNHNTTTTETSSQGTLDNCMGFGVPQQNDPQ